MGGITKTRVIFTEQCPKRCEGCCNKQFNFNDYPTFEYDYTDKEIIITGGEPMLYPDDVMAFCKALRANDYTGKLYMYTAMVTLWSRQVLFELDGMVVTLHDQEDVSYFYEFNDSLVGQGPYDKSLRLNVFKGVNLTGKPLPLWTIKQDIEWIPNCPLPKDERLMVLR